MKKIYSLAAILAFTSNLFAQTVPNGSFEDWNITQGYPEPDGWATFNIFSLFSGSEYGVTQEAPGAVGASYARLTVQADADGIATPAIAFTGNLNILSGVGTTGFPVNNLPNFLSGQYRSEINGDDLAGVACFFTRWNASAGVSDTVAIGSLEIPQSQSNWLSFDMPIVPMMAGTPDTCIILMIAGGGNLPEVGNYLDIDDLHFTGTASIDEPNATTFSVYPNPMSTELTIDLTNMETINELSLFDTQGRLVEKWQLAAIQTSVDVAHLPVGMYILHVSNSRGRWAQSLIKE
jgi:hypothetical protein